MENSLLDNVRQIVLEASKIMLEDQSFSVSEKDSIANIVTTNDVKVQEFLKKELALILPESSFFCEEDDLKDSSKDYVWVIDPIDGTMNYAKHFPISTISVGLTYKKEIILGVVYNPYIDMMFYGEKGKGSYLNGKQIHVSDASFESSILFTAFNSYDKSKSPKAFAFVEDAFYQVTDVRRTGSAAFELCCLAAGKGDLYLEPTLQPYDYAGASIIVMEAGGCISDLEGGLQFEKPCAIIAANKKDNYNRLISIGRKHFCD